MVFFLTKEYLSTLPQLDVSFLDATDSRNPNRVVDAHHAGTICNSLKLFMKGKIRKEGKAVKRAWKDTSFFPSIVGTWDTFLKYPAHPHSEWGAINTWRQKKQIKKLIS